MYHWTDFTTDLHFLWVMKEICQYNVPSQKGLLLRKSFCAQYVTNICLVFQKQLYNRAELLSCLPIVSLKWLVLVVDYNMMPILLDLGLVTFLFLFIFQCDMQTCYFCRKLSHSGAYGLHIWIWPLWIFLNDRLISHTDQFTGFGSFSLLRLCKEWVAGD